VVSFIFLIFMMEPWKPVASTSTTTVHSDISKLFGVERSVYSDI